MWHVAGRPATFPATGGSTSVSLVGVSLVGLLNGRGSAPLSGVLFASMMRACDDNDDSFIMIINVYYSIKAEGREEMLR